MIETDIPYLSESNVCFNITFFWNGKLYFFGRDVLRFGKLVSVFKVQDVRNIFSEMSVWLYRSMARILFSDRFNACSINLLFEKYSYPMKS
jgi:hypothetical protein